MKSRHILSLIVSLVIALPVFSQNLELDIINLLEKYEKYSSFTKDGLSFEESYTKEFTKLFNTQNKIVFNDLKIDTLIDCYTPSQYAAKVKNNFTFGINVTLEIIDIGLPKKTSKDYYEVKVNANKKMYYLDKDQKIQQKDYELIFIISCRKVGSGYQNITIKEIKNKNAFKETSWFNAGFFFQPALTNIATKDWIDSNNIYGNWNQKSRPAFNAGIEVNYMSSSPMKNFGIRIQYGSYSSKFLLDDFEQQELQKVDKDLDTFLLRSSGNQLEEMMKMSFLEIPIFYKIRTNLNLSDPMNFIYLNAGPVIGFKISNSSKGQGIANTKGYYRQYHAELEDIDTYGFITNRDMEFQGETTINSFNISALIEAGVNLPIINKKMYFNVSAFTHIGLINLSSDSKKFILINYNEPYTSLVDSRSVVKTIAYGLNLGLNYIF